jgi:type VI secretion system ImpB/VipA family protein
MPESTQHKLDRIRPPRVQITYDVEIGGAIQKKELPLVVGVLADLAGQPDADRPLVKLKDRKFIEIDRDNFNDVLKKISPQLTFTVPNRLKNDGSKLKVELKFENMDDFRPRTPDEVLNADGALLRHLGIIDQVQELKMLFEARGRLSDLLAKLDGNEILDSKLVAVAGNADSIKQLKAASVTPANAETPGATKESAPVTSASEQPSDKAPEGGK